MSTLKVNTLTDTAATKSVPIEDVVNGTARAWVNFDGTGTVAIRAQYNVASITDNGTGDYTVNFTTALPDANYSTVTNATNGSGARLNNESSVTPINATTTSIDIQTLNSSALFDSLVVTVAVFR